MSAKQSATRYRRMFTERPGAYLCSTVAATALTAAHPEVNGRSAQRYFQSLWFYGTPAHEVLRLMDGPVSELPERILAS